MASCLTARKARYMIVLESSVQNDNVQVSVCSRVRTRHQIESPPMIAPVVLVSRVVYASSTSLMCWSVISSSSLRVQSWAQLSDRHDIKWQRCLPAGRPYALQPSAGHTSEECSVLRRMTKLLCVQAARSYKQMHGGQPVWLRHTGLHA
jgi:hypothetical protein